MRELDLILEAWKNQASGVLATVVHVEGSAYRRPGARMLIQPDGSRIGSISGGCLEGDVARKAAWWTADGPVLRVYDTMSDDDAVWEFGLGCNGVIHVLLERTDSPSVQSMFQFLENRKNLREGSVVATVIRGAQVGTRYLFSESTMASDLSQQAAECLQNRKSTLLHTPNADIFLEWIGPPQKLVIFGAGHDAIPLASMAATMGWNVTVADGRPAYAQANRFPGAHNVVLLPNKVEIDSDTAVVFMTHNYPQDAKLLPEVLKAKPRYLGLLGPQRRTERLFNEIGESITAYDLHSPVGLDIGGDTAESIALSITAEIQARLANRPGGSLKWKRGPIHTPAETKGTLSPQTEDEKVTSLVCETQHA